jgi:hypothetical protein
MSIKELYITLTILTILVCFAFWAFIKDSKCREKDGVLLHGRCIKIEEIK